ncbi:uncharacterized protein LOC135926241 isoform X2 [Gordionus sp. m RMFG-2023]|uniref:uncharacterized protein LOC135926241 isoform X2 n=1 Tax=Gordionus sp. m RMFG-2023 TaxID=3053472 RepID=UPI0031FD5E93
MNLHFKVYFNFDNELIIKRFSLIKENAESFETVKSAIENLTKNLIKSIKYRDDEGDMITLSSDDEIKEAILLNRDHVMKLYVEGEKVIEINVSQTYCMDNINSLNQKDNFSDVKLINEKTKIKCDYSEKNNEIYHPNIICDGCEGYIYGPRFKCSVCYDYDLCSTCESNGKHTQNHLMLKINKPTNITSSDLYTHILDYNLKSNKTDNKRSSTFTCSTSSTNNGKNYCNNTASSCKRNSYDNNQNLYDFGSLLGGFDKFSKNGLPHQNQKTFVPPPPPPPPFPFTCPFTSGRQQRNNDFNDTFTQGFNKNGGNFFWSSLMRSVGQSINTLFDPLGMDVHVDIASPNKDSGPIFSSNININSTSFDKKSPASPDKNNLDRDESATEAKENDIKQDNGYQPNKNPIFNPFDYIKNVTDIIIPNIKININGQNINPCDTSSINLGSAETNINTVEESKSTNQETLPNINIDQESYTKPDIYNLENIKSEVKDIIDDGEVSHKEKDKTKDNKATILEDETSKITMTEDYVEGSEDDEMDIIEKYNDYIDIHEEALKEYNSWHMVNKEEILNSTSIPLPSSSSSVNLLSNSLSRSAISTTQQQEGHKEVTEPAVLAEEDLPTETPKKQLHENNYYHSSITDNDLDKNSDTKAALDKALKQLESMGYVNEGEWLTQLLRMKQYDIHKVLDIIHPY